MNSIKIVLHCLVFPRMLIFDYNTGSWGGKVDKLDKESKWNYQSDYTETGSDRQHIQYPYERHTGKKKATKIGGLPPPSNISNIKSNKWDRVKRRKTPSPTCFVARSVCLHAPAPLLLLVDIGP